MSKEQFIWSALIFIIFIGICVYAVMTAEIQPEEDKDKKVDVWTYDDLPNETLKDVIIMDEEESKVIPINRTQGARLTDHIQSVIDKDSKKT